MTSASLRSAFFSSTSGQKLMGGDGARDNVPGGQDPENSGQNPPPPNVNIEQVNLSQLVQNVNENTNQLVQLMRETVPKQKEKKCKCCCKVPSTQNWVSFVSLCLVIVFGLVTILGFVVVGFFHFTSKFDEMSSQISKQPDTFKNLTTQFERFMEAITKLLKDPRVVSHINASETFNKTEG